MFWAVSSVGRASRLHGGLPPITKTQIINAESAADAKEKVISYCNEQLVDNDRLKEITEVKISNAKDAITEIKNKDLPNGRPGNPVSS